MSKPYQHISPSIRDWPIYKFSKNRKEFKSKLKEHTFDLILQKNEGQLKELLAQCAFSEKKRVTKNPWKVDPASEKGFWLGVSKQISSTQDCNSEEACEALLKKIVSRYVEEIVGGFKVETFIFADKFLTWFFNRIYSSWFAGSILNFFGKKKLLLKKLLVRGEVEETRKLFDKGTVVLLPTHQSNLDSILIGYFLQLVVGVPAFSYGAGLNLYNVEILGRYMNRLGAYKVDRRKRNAIYHETLFTFLKMAVHDGVNNLFFPGGGRVRDGKIEKNLKLGLLSSLIQAQKSNSKEGNDKKIFIVPVVFNYHFVLEAKPLINQHLMQTGKEKFSRKFRKKSSGFLAIISYIFELVKGKSEAVLSFGKAMDVLGNPIDENGNSLDKNGERISLNDYFRVGSEFKSDFQRESIYTKKLAASIAESYREHAVILSSHLVAFLGFQCLLKENKADDIFDLYSIDIKKYNLEYQKMLKGVELIVDHLLIEEKEGRVLIDPDLHEAPEMILQKGIQKLGAFHQKKPLKIYSDKRIICRDVKLLYYYANRLDGFGFESILSQ